MNKHNPQTGSVNPLLIASILLGVVALGFAGAFFWAYSNYVDQRDNTSEKIGSAVTAAKEAQRADDEKEYLEKAKEPYNQLVTPDDLGRVTVSYPKTWSVYVAKSDSSAYEAYLNPTVVPAVTAAQSYAARVVISTDEYSEILNRYAALVKKGDLKSTPVTINNFNGVRLDGKFSSTRSGSSVIFKVRDKTLILATDIDSYRGDFDEVIVKSLDFNP